MFKIELVEAEADRSLHPHHAELWVRVLSKDPLDGKAAWKTVAEQIDTGVLDRFQDTPCAFHVDLWEETDPDHAEFDFEQWWCLPERAREYEQDQA